MFIRRIDLLSQVPQISIFNAGSNKTVFGGALSLIYLIIFLLIAIAYLVDFISNDKYDVQYGIQQEVITKERLDELTSNQDYDPTLNFRMDLQDMEENPLSERFVIYDPNKNIFINKNEQISSNINNLSFAVMYKCENDSCFINPEDKVQFGYQILVDYIGFQLDHQGDIPLHKSDYYFRLTGNFFYNKPSLNYLKWGIIRYSEDRAFLGVLYNLFGGEDEDIIGGYFKDIKNFFLDGILEDSVNREFIEGNYYKVLGIFQSGADYFEIEEYKRAKKGILDVFADISALTMTILEIFVFAFGNFYSGNFDNYKIIEKVLSKEKRANKFRNKDISEDKSDHKNKIELSDNTGKSEALIDDDNMEVKDNKITEEKKDIGGINLDDNDERVIPKLRFIDFMINSFYSDKCCKNSNRQQIISSCNDLVSKYYTVEDIIYNQIKIENLLKDYKWNDPKLKYIENNEFVTELKSYYNI